MREWFVWLYQLAVLVPVRVMYLHGPVRTGMWGGMPSSDICAHLTRVQGEFWIKDVESMDECNTLIERECTAWSVLAVIMLYVYVVVKVVTNITDLVFWVIQHRWQHRTLSKNG